MQQANCDMEHFARQVIRLAGDDLLREQLGREASVYAGEWLATEMTARLLAFYSALHVRQHGWSHCNKINRLAVIADAMRQL